MDSTTGHTGENDPLLIREVIMNVSINKEFPRKSCSQIFSGRILITRPTILVASVVVVCFGLCVVLFHPHKVGDLAVTIRRSLFG